MKALLLVFAAAMAALGFGGLLFPQTVQRLAERAVAMGPTPESLRAFVRSGAYVWNIRLVAILALGVAALLVFVSVRGRG